MNGTAQRSASGRHPTRKQTTFEQGPFREGRLTPFLAGYLRDRPALATP